MKSRMDNDNKILNKKTKRKEFNLYGETKEDLQKTQGYQNNTNILFSCESEKNKLNKIKKGKNTDKKK